jgi:hypothetical protein
MIRNKTRAIDGVVLGTTMTIVKTIQIGARNQHTTDNVIDRLRFESRVCPSPDSDCGASYGLSFTA